MGILNYATPMFEIAVIAVLINYLLSFFWKPKTMDLIIGCMAFFFIFTVSSWLDLPVLRKITLVLGQTALIAFIIIFQPELRLALSKFSIRGKKFKEITELDIFIDQLSHATYRLAEKRMGALIVLENNDLLDDYAQKAVLLNANFSSELLETIFATTTPLHDGAAIIRKNTLLAAAAILPLAEDSSQINKSMGTRHRAALGLSLVSDAIIIIVSEESGRVSVAREGLMTRGVKSDRFKAIIRSIYTPASDAALQKKFNILDWLKN